VEPVAVARQRGHFLGDISEICFLLRGQVRDRQAMMYYAAGKQLGNFKGEINSYHSRSRKVSAPARTSIDGVSQHLSPNL
jgi:hypothetical protein